MRLTTYVLVFGAMFLQVAQTNETRHITFSLVRGSAGFVPSEPGGVMTDAPYIVLAFTAEDGHKALIITDTAGDYTAVLQPGHYCLSAYQVKTGEMSPLDPRQLKCIDVPLGKDVRLDVMLTGVKNNKPPDSSPNP